MSPPLQLHFTGKPSRASEWGRCPECVAWYTENRPAALHASASVGIERDLTTNHALDLYMRGRHAKH